MSRVYFISDLHFGHKSVLKFSRDYRDGDTIEEHDWTLVARWNSVVKKKDRVFVLGDVCWPGTSLDILGELNGTKTLIRGNHDNHKTVEYLEHFDKVMGLVKYKDLWLSHAPIHPNELRGCKNVHGHVHSNSIRHNYTGEIDPRYVNVCVENCEGYPVLIDDIRNNTYVSRRM